MKLMGKSKESVMKTRKVTAAQEVSAKQREGQIILHIIC